MKMYGFQKDWKKYGLKKKSRLLLYKIHLFFVIFLKLQIICFYIVPSQVLSLLQRELFLSIYELIQDILVPLSVYSTKASVEAVF